MVYWRTSFVSSVLYLALEVVQFIWFVGLCVAHILEAQLPYILVVSPWTGFLAFHPPTLWINSLNVCTKMLPGPGNCNRPSGEPLHFIILVLTGHKSIQSWTEWFSTPGSACRVQVLVNATWMDASLPHWSRFLLTCRIILPPTSMYLHFSWALGKRWTSKITSGISPSIYMIVTSFGRNTIPQRLKATFFRSENCIFVLIHFLHGSSNAV